MTRTLRHLFTPHYTNNHRARVLHPEGLTVLIGIFILLQSTLQLIKASPRLPGGFILGYASSISPEEVVVQTNARRAEVGLPPLTINSALTQAAIAKANHMFLQDYWAHVAPDGTTPWVFIKNAGYAYSVAGENLARDFGDTSTMVQAWMDSPTHRDNIVNSKYTEIGIAVVDGKLQGTETTLVVQMFGVPAAAVPKVPKEAAKKDTTQVAQMLPTVAPQTLPTSMPDLATLEPESQPLSQPVLPESYPLTRITRPEVSLLPDSRLSPLLISKAISVSLILLLMLVLIYDGLHMYHKKLPRNVGKNWAHLTFYSVILILIMAITQGKVL